MVFALALLTAAVLPIYRAYVIRACEKEMIEVLSYVKLAQDKYCAAHGHYAGKDELHPVTEDVGLGLSEEDFPKVRYVKYDDLLMSVNYPKADKFLLIWLSPDVNVLGAEIPSIAMDQAGHVYHSDDAESGSWRPAYPHLEE